MENQSQSLREFRRINKLKQKDLADTLGISINQLTKYERGFLNLPPQIVKALTKISDNISDIKIEPSVCGEGYVTARDRAENDKLFQRKSPLINGKKYVLDLFCGVGGFSHGFEKSGDFQVSFGVDILGDRLDTFCANHSSASALGKNIRNLTIEQIDDCSPRPFVIVGGPPCQGFSSLRPFRNVEWNDPRNNLAEEFVRIVAALQPEWIVFENVVGLLTHAEGNTFKSIVMAFEEVGYKTSARIINGAYFGLPQKRERLILIGNRMGKSVNWPKATHYFSQKSMAGQSNLIIKPDNKVLADAVTFLEATSDLPELASGQTATSYRDCAVLTDYQKMMRGETKRLTLHEATKHSDKMLEIIRHSGYNIHALPLGMVTSGFSSCYSRLAANEPSTTMTVNFVHPASNRCIHPFQDRALTPREGARLQSFEDSFNFMGNRSQTVKQIGNAVPPLLGKIVADTILRSD